MHHDNVSVAYDGPTEFITTDRSHRTMSFTIEASEPIPAGTRFRLVLGHFRSLRDSNAPGFRQWRSFTAEVEGGPERGRATALQQPPSLFYEMGGARLSGELFNHFILGLAEVAEPIAPRSPLRLSVAGMLGHQAPVTARLFVQARPPQPDDDADVGFTQLGPLIELVGKPGRAVAIEARLRATPDEHGVFGLHVHATDGLGNPTGPNVQADQLDCEPVGPSRVRDGGVVPETERPVRLRVRDRGSGFESLTNPVQRDRFDGRRVCFGDIHWHCNFSGDGDRELEQAYEYARDTLGLDFAAVTDHTPGDFWEQTLAINERYHEPGHFVTLPAWEWSTDTGHSNIYLRTPDVPAGPEHARTADHPGSAEWPEDTLVVPHHTNIVSKELRPDGSHYWWQFDWTRPNFRVRLVEIAQTRGNFEADELDEDWGVITRGLGASIRDALAMGYRVGFIAGTDNHVGFPSRQAEAGRSGFLGLACVLADDLSREAIWRAMDARRTYGTSGKPILCHWSVNGHEMGREASLEGDRVSFSASLRGTSPIERVEVVSNGQIVWRSHPDTYDVTISEEALPTPKGESAYYYLRLRQHDGHRAWLSPVWLDR
jgi:hypothetical protein